MKRVKILAAGIFLLSLTLSSAAFAASVTLAGNTVDFTFDDAMLGMFGQARLSGDTLFFNPVNFKTMSLNGAGYALTNDTMNIQVSAHAGLVFSTIDLVEKGDYLLRGSDSTAEVTGQVRIFDIAKPLVDVTASILPAGLLDQTRVSTQNWVAGASADLTAWNSAQSINVTVENLLLASTGAPSSLAFVQKKFVGLTPTLLAVTPVPEAETYAMMLAGLGLVGFAVVRRRAISK
ncbi:MAG: PEP-CTERM sorting domain-containing protein [Polaromonas sp.]